MLKRILGNINPAVFWISLTLAVTFVFWGIVNSNNLGEIVFESLNFILANFGWTYLLGVMFFLVFALLLALSKYGSIKLGKDDDVPEYSTLSWFSMLFSAGMGIGLLFWSVAEPITHYINPPFGKGSTPEAAEIAMRYTFFHWGLHPWAIYVIVGLALAYAQFRKGLPSLISSTLYPILGEKINGIYGKTVDILAVFVTLVGVATSLGMGAMQINSGLQAVYGLPNSLNVTLIIIVVVTILFILSAVTGISKGIKLLSNTNIALLILLMIFLLVLGPTRFIANLFVDTLGGYLHNFIKMSFWTDSVKQGGWANTWTVTYWAWWISWGPFVGGFIARISRGRTIREFILGVLIAPAIFSFIFLSIFGGTGLYQEIFSGGGVASAVNSDVSSALFVILDSLQLAGILSIIATVLIGTFFITSADSATFVLSMMTSNGNLQPKVGLKILWGVVEAAIAAVLLIAGGLSALQTVSIVAVFPFFFVMFVISYAMLKALRSETCLVNLVETEVKESERI